MFGIGMPEMILILAIALIVIGPKKLPDLAKSLGRAMREFKKATNEFKDTLQIDDELSEVKTAFDDINKDVSSAVDIIPAEPIDKTEKIKNGQKVEDAAEAKTEGSEAIENLKNLKNAYDELNANEASPEGEKVDTVASSEEKADDDEKKDEKKAD